MPGRPGADPWIHTLTVGRKEYASSARSKGSTCMWGGVPIRTVWRTSAGPALR